MTTELLARVAAIAERENATAQTDKRKQWAELQAKAPGLAAEAVALSKVFGKVYVVTPDGVGYGTRPSERKVPPRPPGIGIGDLVARGEAEYERLHAEYWKPIGD